MENLASSTARALPGQDRGTPPVGNRWTQAVRRRKSLLRSLRADPDLTSTEFKILEACLDRVDVLEPNFVVYDSVKSVARRTGLGIRSVELVHASLVRKGRIARVKFAELAEFIGRKGAGPELRFPSLEGRPRVFTVLLTCLPGGPPERAKDCAFERAFEPEKDCARNAQGSSGGNPKEIARSLPIWNESPSERAKLNRQEDEDLAREKTQTGGSTREQTGLDEVAELLALAGGDDPITARLARSTLVRLGHLPPGPAQPPPAGEPAITPRMESIAAPCPAELPAAGLSFSAAAALGQPAPPRPRRAERLSDLVRSLPGAPSFRVASVARALMAALGDAGNALTEQTYRKYLDLVRLGGAAGFSAELVAGLVDDACLPGVERKASHLSHALREEWGKVEAARRASLTVPPGGRS